MDPDLDPIAKQNRQYWTAEVTARYRYTRPWLDLDPEQIHRFARGNIDTLPEPYIYIYPRHIFEQVAGKTVLCLGSGGGQQSAIFGLLGARVTALDLTDAQLENDRKAARHYGYDITTVQGDMRDLSAFPNETFDLVYQAISICFVSDVRPVYREVARVLKPGGIYRVGHLHAATVLVDEDSWTGAGYVLPGPVRGGRIEDDAYDAVVFCHLYSDIFNGLTEAGLRIQTVWEDPRHLKDNLNSKPGTYDHLLSYTQSYFAVVAKKELILH